MIENLPYSITILFSTSVVFTIVFYYLANKESKKTTVLLIFWALIQSFIASTGFYTDTDVFPPHFIFVILPPFIVVSIGIIRKQKYSISKLNEFKYSTLLHFIRLPVELVLFLLFQQNLLPELMTFEGRNFDILAGITAPLISWLYVKDKISNKWLLTWNVIGLGLVLFVLVNGILSARMPIQLLAFDQPSIAFEYAPFILLPSLIVPVVVYTHLVDIIKLLRITVDEKRKNQVLKTD